MIRIGKNQDYSTAVCKDCEAPFWKDVWCLKGGCCAFWLLFMIVILSYDAWMIAAGKWDDDH